MYQSTKNDYEYGRFYDVYRNFFVVTEYDLSCRRV